MTRINHGNNYTPYAVGHRQDGTLVAHEGAPGYLPLAEGDEYSLRSTPHKRITVTSADVARGYCIASSYYANSEGKTLANPVFLRQWREILLGDPHCCAVSEITP